MIWVNLKLPALSLAPVKISIFLKPEQLPFILFKDAVLAAGSHISLQENPFIAVVSIGLFYRVLMFVLVSTRLSHVSYVYFPYFSTNQRYNISVNRA